MHQGSSAKVNYIDNGVKKLLFQSLNLNDVGVYKCKLINIIELNKIIFEIKNDNGILRTEWSSNYDTPISIDVSSDHKANEYIREYHSNLTINCISSNGIK